MSMRYKVWMGVLIVVLGGIGLWGQTSPAPLVVPIPIPGGDLLAPYGVFNLFFPGVNPPGVPAVFDGPDAEPHGITNFRGIVAMGYTNGLTNDGAYQIVTDIRVYKGDYIGAQATYPAGGTTSKKACGTFVEI